MPTSMSLERRKMLNFLGAKITLTPKEFGMNGAIQEAEKFINELKIVLFLISSAIKPIQESISTPLLKKYGTIQTAELIV